MLGDTADELVGNLLDYVDPFDGSAVLSAVVESAPDDSPSGSLHVAVAQRDGRILAAGGRVLNVTARGASLREAADRAYAMVERIDWPEGFCRRDIGWRALK